MFLDQINSKLFRPLASPNAKYYGIGIWALYNRLIANQLDSDECSPKEARDIIRLALIENAAMVQWEAEPDPNAAISDEDTDTAGRIYRYLKECGWLNEMEDIGYRKVTFIPQQCVQIINALTDIRSGISSGLGPTCQGVYSSLLQLRDKPRENANNAKFSADNAKRFYKDLSGLSGSCREIAFRMNQSSESNQLFTTFFNEFLKGVILTDYSKLKSENHPYRYRVATLSLVIEIQASDVLINDIVEVLCREQGTNDRSQIKAGLMDDLAAIQHVFQNMDSLLVRIEEYRRLMTRRTREAMQYALQAIPELGLKIDSLVKQVIEVEDDLEFPALLVTENYISAERQYAPMDRMPPLEKTSLKIKTDPPYADIAKSRLMTKYFQNRQDNPKRIDRYLISSMKEKMVITTDDLPVESLDDFLAYLQLRNLVHGAVSKSSIYYPLLERYRIYPIDGLTENPYLVAPRLRIERRAIARRDQHAS